jgi:hypothetical protein
MAADQAAATMATVEEFLEGREHQVSSSRVLELSVNSRLSAYDCEFIADRAVLKAFPDVALSMESFLTSTAPTAHEVRARYRRVASK